MIEKSSSYHCTTVSNKWGPASRALRPVRCVPCVAFHALRAARCDFIVGPLLVNTTLPSTSLLEDLHTARRGAKRTEHRRMMQEAAGGGAGGEIDGIEESSAYDGGGEGPSDKMRESKGLLRSQSGKHWQLSIDVCSSLLPYLISSCCHTIVLQPFICYLHVHQYYTTTMTHPCLITIIFLNSP